MVKLSHNQMVIQELEELGRASCEAGYRPLFLEHALQEQMSQVNKVRRSKAPFGSLRLGSQQLELKGITK